MRWPNGRARQWLSICLNLLLLVSLGLGLTLVAHPAATHALGSATGTATGAPAPSLPQPVASITSGDGKPLNPTEPIVVHVANGTASAVAVKDARTGRAERPRRGSVQASPRSMSCQYRVGSP